MIITHSPCCHVQNKTRKPANLSCGIILKYLDKYLIVQGPSINGKPGIWSIPKGHPNASKEVLEIQGPYKWYTKTEDSEYNECAQCCAIRELFEETGIKITEKDIVYGPYLRRYFTVELKELFPVITQKDEVINYKWVDINELKELYEYCNSDLKRFIKTKINF
jgi:8-oxo-dGTP pyrophosphatase MutT (NUDIX family)